MVYYFSSEKHDAHIDFSKKLSSFLNSADAFSHPIAVMCIGSDRSTGDSLGPLIGYKLSKFAFNSSQHIFKFVLTFSISPFTVFLKFKLSYGFLLTPPFLSVIACVNFFSYFCNILNFTKLTPKLPFIIS